MKNKKFVLILLSIVLLSALSPSVSAEPGEPVDFVEIETEEDFEKIRSDLNGRYLLKNDITISSDSDVLIEWKSIGNYSHPFNGVFDGAGNKIIFDGDVVFETIKSEGINSGNHEFDGYGFFGNVGETGTIKNLIISAGGSFSCPDKYIPGGVLAGYLDGTAEQNATISGCSVIIDSSVDSASINGGFKLGGLIGLVWNGTIDNSGSEIDVVSTQDSAGGLIGYIFNGDVSYCYAKGDVSLTGEGYVGNNGGGLIGEIEEGSVSQCYASGSVTAKNNAGGLIGFVTSEPVIQNVYAEGDVHCKGDSAGGLIGLIKKWSSPLVYDSYA